MFIRQRFNQPYNSDHLCNVNYICRRCMSLPVQHNIYENSFWLLPQKALYWEQEKALVVADLHLGKTGHFRKSGIAVPQAVYKDDLHRLFGLMQQYKTEQLIIVGDMFHSIANKELDLFLRWRNDFASLHIQLVKGNHDILKDDYYQSANIQLSEEKYNIGRFSFVHDPVSCEESSRQTGNFYFCGHIHPGILVRGGSRQALRFPCYHFTSTHAILPAFSGFTGLYMVSKKEHEQVFAIVNNNIIEL